MKEFIPHATTFNNFKERMMFMTVSLCGLYDELVVILSFGFFATNLRAAALFDWFDDYDGE